MADPLHERDDGFAAPLDAADPRFAGSHEAARGGRGERSLVRSGGPGSLPDNPRVRWLRVAIPAVFLAGVAAVVAVFVVGLDPGPRAEVVGPEAAVLAAVAERPQRVCYQGAQPCAWLTIVDGELLALSTDGPLISEFGRLGVSWCPSSGGFGSVVTGSRWDAAGNVVRGPAPRGVDRLRVVTNSEGDLQVDFFSRTTGLQAGRAPSLIPPSGPDCDQIPFDREADLKL